MGICKESVFYTPARFRKKPVSRSAILLSLSVLILAVSSVNAQLSIGVNQKGLDCGMGVLDSNKIDLVLKGNFSYFSADSFSSAWAVSASLIIAYRFFRTQGFKIYVATGPYAKYASYSAAYMSFGQFTDVNDPRREVLLGWNVLALRPEAIINKRVSAYAHIPLVLYQFGTQAGNKNLLINFISSDALGMNDGMPEIGIRFCF
jgi:hypothetical protein